MIPERDRHFIFVNSGIAMSILVLISLVLLYLKTPGAGISFISGALISCLNLLLLTLGLWWLFKRRIRKFFVYSILIIKSIFLYGGVAFVIIKLRTNPVVFLAGFTAFMWMILVLSFAKRGKLRDARA